ncbi:MAG: polysulfide reductase NrfD [Deltaproteobacteria bacterium]|jgi:molybdopterin-containing oxidoreductase family membrane subunit|nr:polysulfide reductase NrfD [Deltaproteobacteria bacterium]
MNQQRVSNTKGFLCMLGLSVLLFLLGIWAAWQIESGGHILTGMNNSVPWGFSLTLATFLLVAASGVLNVASLSSVFGKQDYKPLASFSCLLALALLAGGLFTLMLDLGRPGQVFLALTRFNWTSVFSINIVIYAVFFGLVGLYLLFTCFAPQSGGASVLGFVSFLWRLVMTTGSGCVFAVLAGRSAMHSALLLPLFIALSLSLGLAMYIISLHKAQFAAQRPFFATCTDELTGRMRTLLAVLVSITCYMVLALHLIGLNSPALREFERFALCTGGIFPTLLWGGFGLIGTAIPLILLLLPQFRACNCWLLAAAIGVTLGSLALMYVLVIAPQVYPVELFPGKIVTDAFYGQTASYSATALEWLVGLCGLGLAGIVMLLGIRIVPVLPASTLDNK